jgi:hypothetical protein
MSDQTSALTERIAFAEEWLDRAKRQLADGNVAHGSLHLILAEAELHRAREVSGTPESLGAPRARRAPWPVLGACAVAVAGIATAFLWQVSAVPVSADARAASWPVVTFSEQTGHMLRIVSTPEAPLAPTIVERTVERTIVKPMIVRVTVPAPAQPGPVAPSAPVVSSVTAPALVPAAPQPAHASAAPPTATVFPPAAPVLSEADVIDLVLAAERSLRRPAKH